EVPIEIVRYGLAPDSGGAGENRGGLGTWLEFKVFSPGTRITARNRDRTRFRPWGILGGKAGRPSNFIRNPDTPKEEVLGNQDTLTAEPGDVIRFYGPGGGGRGNPLERDPARVLRDVERGALSLDAARTDYGVVIVDGSVDEAATTARRNEMRNGGSADAHFDFGPEREEYERHWTPEAYDAMTEIMASLPNHWRFFVKARIFDAMNASETGGADVVRSAFTSIKAEHPQIAAE
ncbi:MAG: hydantoinase B/oxoprolinase family protein, partial [Alphaproteobacteria bacterium]|nr:hydantoinase B/oxoprolinase family protein [Alphaproteobacteria bacterium]